MIYIGKTLDKERSQIFHQDVNQLSEFVHGSDVLSERLNQPGLVNKSDGEALSSKLTYGQKNSIKKATYGDGTVWS